MSFQWRIEEAGWQVAIADTAIEEMRIDFEIRGIAFRGVLLGKWDARNGRWSISNSIPIGDGANAETSLEQNCEEIGGVLDGWRTNPALPSPLGVYAGCDGDGETFCRQQAPGVAKYCVGPANVTVLKGVFDGAPQSRVLLFAGDRGIVAQSKIDGYFDSAPDAAAAAVRSTEVVHVNSMVEAEEPAPPAGNFDVARILPDDPVIPAFAQPTGSGPESDAPVPRVERRRLGWLAALAVGTVGLSIFVINGYRWLQRGTTQPPANSAAEEPVIKLGLRAERSGQQVAIRWDAPSAPERVRSACLYVDDGGRRTQFFLENAELRAGRVMYSPVSSRVAVRLEVETVSDGVARESLIMIDTTRADADAVRARSAP